MAMLYAAGHPGAAVRNLVLMATPIDFGAMGPMVAALRGGRLNADDLLDETGNVPADALYSGFYMLAPTTEIAQRATLLENLWNDEFVEAYQAMAQWTRDHVPFPGATFRQVVGQLVRENVLMTGAIRLGDRVVRLADVRGEVLVAMAEHDGVVPAAATEPALELVGDARRRHALRLPGGHVTFGAGKAARKHTMPRLTEWITAHSDQCTDPEEAGWRSGASSQPIGRRSNVSSTRSRMRTARS
jgi:polyhydroxyalkanoate synthase